ncbi:MAG: hypothetical protein Q4D32_10075 [Eubacteriales bacterium]|nr:hypothetical protein [Eubacteriales bacterium]
MNKDEYQIEGFSFRSREDYQRAMKEKETVAYLKANTRPGDGKALLKVYNRSIEKESFRTVIGIEYLVELRKQLIASGIVTADALAPVPVRSGTVSESGKDTYSASIGLEQQVKRYKAAYESARVGRAVKNMTIIILLVVIFVMVFMTYKSQYSVFTYFTNYKEDMRNELIDEYEHWQQELEQKEQELDDREASLQDTGK